MNKLAHCFVRPLYEEAAQKKPDLEKELLSLQNRHRVAQSKCERLKQQLESKKDHYQRLMEKHNQDVSRLEDAEKDLQRLQSLVIEDPGQLLGNVEALKRRIVDKRDDISEGTNKLRAKESRLQELKNTKTVCVLCICSKDLGNGNQSPCGFKQVLR